jgi:deoxycytidine triphosphate deaminase
MPPHAPVAPSIPTFPTPQQAAARFERWRNTDPFPGVKPALLNAADLLDYIATVGMFSPYEIPHGREHEWVKPASCGIRCSGEYISYDYPRDSSADPEPREGKVDKANRLKLPPNSITYLQPDTFLRLPNYLAARFNLTIREIHRGILVGTGPLVDPGYVGQLLIPLHNLTNNTYTIQWDEPVIWVEFTKLSHNSSWGTGHGPPRVASFVPYRKREKRETAPEYLDHANEGRPIVSSVRDIDQRSQRTEKRVQETRRISLGTAAAVLALIAALFAGCVGAFIYTLTYANGQAAASAMKVNASLSSEVTVLKRQICTHTLSTGDRRKLGCAP